MSHFNDTQKLNTIINSERTFNPIRAEKDTFPSISAHTDL